MLRCTPTKQRAKEKGCFGLPLAPPGDFSSSFSFLQSQPSCVTCLGSKTEMQVTQGQRQELGQAAPWGMSLGVVVSCSLKSPGKQGLSDAAGHGLRPSRSVARFDRARPFGSAGSQAAAAVPRPLSPLYQLTRGLRLREASGLTRGSVPREQESPSLLTAARCRHRPGVPQGLRGE